MKLDKNQHCVQSPLTLPKTDSDNGVSAPPFSSKIVESASRLATQSTVTLMNTGSTQAWEKAIKDMFIGVKPDLLELNEPQHKKPRLIDLSDINPMLLSSLHQSETTKKLAEGKPISSFDQNEIYECVTNHFSYLSNESIKEILVREYSDNEMGEEIREAIWSWTHLLEYTSDKLDMIAKPDEKIKITCSDDVDGHFFLHHRSDDKEGVSCAIFCCDNANAIRLQSEKMFNAVFEMNSFSDGHLMFILDNYVLGSSTMPEQKKLFNTLENRNKVFSSEHFGKETLGFLVTTQHEDGDESPLKKGFVENEFISKNVAKQVFDRIIPNEKNRSNVSHSVLVDLCQVNEIMCHLNDSDIKRLVDHVEKINVDFFDAKEFTDLNGDQMVYEKVLDEIIRRRD